MVVSGTTPSGCTQRAPTGVISTRYGLTSPSDEQQQKGQALRLPPTARSRRQSQGLHPVGALSVPPQEWYPLGTVRPVRVTAKQQKKTHSRREEIPSNQLLDAGPAPNHSIFLL